MAIDIKAKSHKRDSVDWISRVDVYIHEGNTTRHIGWEWPDQKFDTRLKADRFAVLAANQLLIKRGLSS